MSDSDTVHVAEREMKAFVVNQVTDWDKLKVLIDTIARWNGPGRQDQVKLYIIVAEVFQYQVLEYLPSMFTVLNDKIRSESSLE